MRLESRLESSHESRVNTSVFRCFGINVPKDLGGMKGQVSPVLSVIDHYSELLQNHPLQNNFFFCKKNFRHLELFSRLITRNSISD